VGILRLSSERGITGVTIVMGLYKTYQTSPKLEKEGVWREFSDCRVLVARAGGSNQKYNAIMEKFAVENKRALAGGLLSNERSMEVLLNSYVQSIVLAWETVVDGQYVSGIENPDGDDLLPFTPENVKNTLTNLPDMFAEIREIASGQQFYRAALIEGATKN
jgi:hypothetical protein